MAAMTEAVEIRLAQAHRSINKQDKRFPMLIHIEDGRLIPNVPRLGGRKEIRDANGRIIEPAIQPHPMYRVFRGDPKAPKAERLRLLREGLNMESAPVVDPAFLASPAAAFDIATANADELVAFASEQYGMNLKATTPIHLLRGRIKAAAAKSGDLAPPVAGGLGATLGPAGDEPDDGLS